MSLSVYLYSNDFRDETCPHCNTTFQVAQERKELYSANITHNLNTMADAAGIYQACWRPDEVGLVLASQLIPVLKTGLHCLLSSPDYYKRFGAPNGWGVYEDLLCFVRNYLAACEENPNAKVEVSR